MTSTNALPMPVAEALANGAPRNLGALASTATARGWGAMVERNGDAWTLVVSTPSDSRTGRYTWRAGKWATAGRGYRDTVAWYRSAPDAVPGAEAVSEAADAVEKVTPSTDVEAAGLATLRDASSKITDAVAEARKAVQEAEACHAEACEAGEAAEAARTTREAEDWAEEAEDAAGRAPECVKRAKSALRRVQAQRRAIQAAARAVEELGLDEGYRRTAVEAEDTARELLGEAEGAAEEAQNWAEAARETAGRVCPLCRCFMRRTGCATHARSVGCGACVVGQCGCRAVMLATLDRAGSTVARTVDAEAVRVGYLLESEDAARVDAGQLMLAGDWDAAEDALAEADGPAEDALAEADGPAEEEREEAQPAEREEAETADTAPVAPHGAADVERARKAAEEWPEAMEARSLDDRYEGEFRRSDLLSELSVCGERFPFRFHFKSGGGHTVTLPTGDVCGTWGEVTGAAIAYVIEERPATVLRAADEMARVYGIHAEQAAERAEENARTAVSVGMARAALDTVRAFAQRIEWDGLTDEQYDSARGAVREAEQHAERAESAYGRGDVYAARWAARDALAVARWFGLDAPSAQECAERAPEARAVAGRARPQPSMFLLRITRPGWEGPGEAAESPAGDAPTGSGTTSTVPAEEIEGGAAAESDAARRNEERAAEEAAAAAVRRARRRVEEAEEKAAEARRRAEGLDAAAGVHYGRFAGGQPILMGHHSARGALRDRARGDAATRKAIEATAEAERAERAARKARQEAELAETVNGRSRPWERADFQRGDVVEVRKIYTASYVVVRANAKTLTLRNTHTIDDVKGRYDQVLSRTRDGRTITNPGQDDAPSVKGPALSEGLDESTTTTRQAPAGVGGFSRELDADASIEEAPELVLGTGNPDDSARVVLCWGAAGAGALDRWEVTASWRGHGFRVAQHKGEWFITREQMHPADLSKNPKQWRKGEQVRHADRRPIRSRVEAEALMIARVEERRGREAEVRGIIKAAAEGPAPKWTPAPSIIKPRKAPRADWSPADVLAEWGDSVSYEEIAEEEAEDVAPLDAAAGHPALVECQAAADLLVAYAEEHPLDEAAEGWAFEAVERVAMCAWAVEEEDEERAGEYARAAKGERAALTLGRLDEAGPMTPERLAALDADTLALLRWYAGPWPVRWLWPPEKDAPRVINLFHGPGGWSVGIRDVLGATVDMVGVDLDPGAVATAEAAGFEMIRASVTDLDPECPALQWVTGIILSPPCQAFSPAGLRMGRYASAIELIVSVVRGVGAAAGFLALVDAEGRDAGNAPRSGETWEEVRAPLAELEDPRAGLMAEVVVWPLAMLARGGSVEWVAVEQSSALPSEIERGLINEFVQAGWGTVEAETLDAVRYGAASHRKRRFLTAHRTRSPFVSVHPTEAFPVTTFAECAGWERGRSVNTRGQRGIDPKTGRPKGGNAFSADRPSTCVTATAYGWKDDESGEKVTQATIGRLVGFPGDYPWKHVGRGAGIRNRAQQAADAVCPMVAAAIIGRALNVEEWELRARAYAEALYRRTLRPEAPHVAIVPRPRPAVPAAAEAPAAASTTSATSARVPLPAATGGPAPAAGAPVPCPLSRRADAGGFGGVRAGHSTRQGTTRQPTRQGARQPTAPGAGSRGPPPRPGGGPGPSVGIFPGI